MSDTIIQTIDEETLLLFQNIANEQITEYSRHWEEINDPSIPYDIRDLCNNIRSNIRNKGYSLKVALQIRIEFTYIPDSVQIIYYNNNTDYIHKLPSNLKILYCEYISQLPPLPDGLEELHCTNSYIRELPRLPESLRVLVCTHSYIKHIPNIPPNLEHLDYESTSIEEYISNLPSTLKILKCGNNGFRTLGYIPPALEHFSCKLYEGPLPEFPSTIQIIDLPRYTSAYIDIAVRDFIDNCIINRGDPFIIDFNTLEENINNTLKSEDINHYLLKEYELHIPYIPDDVEILICSQRVFTIPNLPVSLKKLVVYSIATLPNLPDGLESLEMHSRLIKTITHLPESLRILDCNGSGLSELQVIPPRLEVLRYAGTAVHTFIDGLPSTLRELNCDYNELTELGQLPPNLEYLSCKGNSIVSFPELPASLHTIIQ
jgi:Leucine-rich repeat (LRR) protein